MKRVFADTAFFVCLGSADDAFHQLAVDLLQRFHDRIKTTEYVLVELGNWFSKAEHRQSFVTLMDQLPLLPQLAVVPASHDLFDRGVDLFRRRHDIDWSMTDCISFALMEHEGLTQALTTDHHFEQAGFTILLK